MARALVKTPIDKVVIKQKEGSEGIMLGSNTEVILNGKKIKGATAVKFEVESKSIAKVTIEMLADVKIEGKFILGEYTETKKELTNERKKS